MNPIFISAAMAGVRAAKNRPARKYASPKKKTEIYWNAGEDRVDSLGILSNDVAMKRYDLPDGKKVDVKQIHAEQINPKEKHFTKSALLGVAALVGGCVCAALSGVPLIVAGVVAGASAIGSITEGVKGAKSPKVGFKNEVIRGGEVWVEKDKDENRRKLVYKEKFGPSGQVKDNDRNPTFIGWIENKPL
ncbi:MAG: hypothetical protein K8T10_02775 [Candidatus Eremiobacteraeota bacterium]|nr:hypothetical protein [Candidatus Eremiobacteraeota bacterium]